MRVTALIISLLLTPWLPRSAQAEVAAPKIPFRANDELDLQALERAVRDGAPDIASSRRAVAAAQTDAQQARLWGNPSIDAAWSTIPLGTTTPRDLERPMANVPNYGATLNYTFPWGKRAPRRQQADALARAAESSLAFVARGLALDLADVLGRLATTTLRREGISSLLAGGKRATELAEARYAAKFGTPLDVDQLKIEVERTQQMLLAVESDIQLALADCAALVGASCESFADASSARAYLERWLDISEVPMRQLEERADLRALQSYGAAARAEGELARAERLPDPTVHLGYLHDRFIISGNQRNSINVGVSLPLPMFDRGQVRERAAKLSREQLIDERARRIAATQARIPALQRRLQTSRERCQRLNSEVIPKARDVLASLESAVENRLLPLTQVIQSRRIVSELFIEEADSCGDAYLAAIELVRENPAVGEMQ